MREAVVAVSAGDSRRSAATARGRTRASFSVHGLSVSVEGEWPEVIEELRRDFAWFESGGAGPPAALELTVERRPPDLDSFGELEASFVTPRNVVFQAPGRTVVDYFGKAACVVDRATGSALFQGTELHLVHEACYQFLSSRIGEHLDAIGLTRLHALGLAGSQGGVAVLLPSGGGKSTLALRAVRDGRVRLLSEDSPLIDRRGRLHPMPLRIAVNVTDAESLPAERVRRMERMEFHPKLVLDLEAFLDRVETGPMPLRHLVIGTRTLGRSVSLRPLPRRGAVGPLLREAVIGVGIYQGMEFVLQRGMRDAIFKGGTALGRAGHCGAGLARARTWRLVLGRDAERNWEALLPLLV